MNRRFCVSSLSMLLASLALGQIAPDQAGWRVDEVITYKLTYPQFRQE